MVNYKKLKSIEFTIDSENTSPEQRIILTEIRKPDQLVINSKQTIEKIILQTPEFKPIAEFYSGSNSYVIDIPSVGSEIFVVKIVFSDSGITKSLLYI
ncbi:MAG: hypothetical protein WCO02_07350 [Bacteroidota bacterium]